jgi:hypothetical protein
MLKPQLQSFKVIHITEVCNIYSFEGEKTQLAFNFSNTCPDYLKKILVTSIVKEAENYGFEIVNTFEAK